MLVQGRSVQVTDLRGCLKPRSHIRAELVVRVLERNRAAEYRLAQKETEYFHQRHLDCFDRQAVLFVDVGSLPWSVMLCNNAFTQVMNAPLTVPASYVVNDSDRHEVQPDCLNTLTRLECS